MEDLPHRRALQAMRQPEVAAVSGPKQVITLPDDVVDPVELARELTPLAIRTLADIATNGSSEAARANAANALLDRAHGKPGQSLALTGAGGGPLDIKFTLTYVRPDGA